MTTLILGSLGTLIGGPIGGAIGALVGRQVDAAIIGGTTREGARLKDLSITTSSYGAPIPRHFGRVRAAGNIIWATELQENKETSGGGKGKPKVTSYSYSSSFAVALGSRPIADIGRIWADGNLLRGSGGDLKVGGAMRFYPGHGDQPVDPLMAAALGSECPAFRHTAYVVFEDLQLEDFGNRIPALSFELLCDNEPLGPGLLADGVAQIENDGASFASLRGYSHETGGLADVLAPLGMLYPASVEAGSTGVKISAPAEDLSDSPSLPDAVASGDSRDFGARDGRASARDGGARKIPPAIRYYDTDRDYQPGLQRVARRSSNEDAGTFEFPGSLSSQSARALIENAHGRQRSQRETLSWRMAQLDPALGPGAIVRVPGHPGYWLVEGWEWRDAGVELELTRQASALPGAAAADPGTAPPPRDSSPYPTLLRAFELPWDGAGGTRERQLFAVLASETPEWSGANLYAERAGQLEPVAQSGSTQGAFGVLATPLASSPALLFESSASIEVETATAAMGFESSDLAGLAIGRNRAMIGNELVQFATAEQLGPTRWRLAGLLRGRGGTEPAAATGHPVDTHFTALGHGLVALGAQMALDGSETPVAAIGRGDSDPVVAPVANYGLGTRPLCPVHAQTVPLPNGDLRCSWTRRARGTWQWDESPVTPINEDSELYRVGIGPLDAPQIEWETGEPLIVLPETAVTAGSGNAVWVRQVGRSQMSDALLLRSL